MNGGMTLIGVKYSIHNIVIYHLVCLMINKVTTD